MKLIHIICLTLVAVSLSGCGGSSGSRNLDSGNVANNENTNSTNEEVERYPMEVDVDAYINFISVNSFFLSVERIDSTGTVERMYDGELLTFVQTYRSSTNKLYYTEKEGDYLHSFYCDESQVFDFYLPELEETILSNPYVVCETEKSYELTLLDENILSVDTICSANIIANTTFYRNNRSPFLDSADLFFSSNALGDMTSSTDFCVGLVAINQYTSNADFDGNILSENVDSFSILNIDARNGEERVLLTLQNWGGVLEERNYSVTDNPTFSPIPDNEEVIFDLVGMNAFDFRATGGEVNFQSFDDFSFNGDFSVFEEGGMGRTVQGSFSFDFFGAE